MAASSAEIQKVRLFTNETSSSSVFKNDEIAEAIEAHPLGTDPETYDLHLAAADVWDIKCSSLAAKYSFSADGASFQLNQQFQNAERMSRYHRSRRRVRSVTVVTGPFDSSTFTIGNPPEGSLQ